MEQNCESFKIGVLGYFFLVCLDFKVPVFTAFSSIQSAYVFQKNKNLRLVFNNTDAIIPVLQRNTKTHNEITRHNKLARYTVYTNEETFILKFY